MNFTKRIAHELRTQFSNMAEIRTMGDGFFEAPNPPSHSFEPLNSNASLLVTLNKKFIQNNLSIIKFDAVSAVVLQIMTENVATSNPNEFGVMARDSKV